MVRPPAPTYGPVERALGALIVACVMATSALLSYLWATTPQGLPQGSADAAYRLIAPCLDAQDRQACMDRGLVTAVLTQGPRAAFAAYDRLRAEDPGMAMYCHQAGHMSGVLAFRSVGGAVRDALVYVGRSCQGAYAHGVLDEWGRSQTLPEDWNWVVATCLSAPEPMAAFLCFDGVGHVVHHQSDSWAEATRRCGASRMQVAREGCVSGLVMQQWAPLRSAQAGPEQYDTLRDIPRVCASLPDWDQGTLVSPGWPGGDGSAGSACRRAASYPFAQAMQASTEPLESSLAGYQRNCRALEPSSPQSPDVRYCLEQAGWALLYATGMDPVAAARACQALPPQARPGCLESLEQGVLADGSGRLPARTGTS